MNTTLPKRKDSHIRKSLRLLERNQKLNEVEDNHVTIQDLPVEIKILIFSYLTHKDLCESVASVCKDWYRLFSHPLLWTNLKIYYYSWESRVRIKKIWKMLSRCTMLEKLVVEGQDVDYVTHQILTLAFPCQRLKTLEVHNSRLSCHFFQQLSVECPLLESLTIVDCDIYAYHHEIGCAVARLKMITHLKFDTWEIPLDESSMMMLLDRCENLVNLQDLSSFGTNNLFHTIAFYSKNRLKVLRIKGHKVTDEGMMALACCTGLVDLQVQQIFNFSERTLDALISIGYESFDLNSSCYSTHGFKVHIRSEALIRFLAHPSRKPLRRLCFCKFSNFNDYVLERLCDLCPDLTDLGFRMCPNVTNSGLQHYLDRNPQIRWLDISGAEGLSVEMIMTIPKRVKLVDRDLF